MSALELFASDDYSVRTVTIGGEPWFVAADVCRALDISNVSMALSRIDMDDLSSTEAIDSMGRMQVARTVNEAGLYELVLASRKPEARTFKRWITHDVIPAIRKTGSYVAAPAFAIPQTYAEALMVAATLAAEGERKDARIAELEPAAAFADRLAGEGGDYSVRDAAQILDRDPNISTGERRLFASLKAIGWVDRKGTPYQGQVNARRLVQRIYDFKDPSTGATRVGSQVRITPKGLQELHRRLGGVASLVLVEQQALAIEAQR